MLKKGTICKACNPKNILPPSTFSAIYRSEHRKTYTTAYSEEELLAKDGAPVWSVSS
jgi:hypothetical protein